MNRRSNGIVVALAAAAGGIFLFTACASLKEADDPVVPPTEDGGGASTDDGAGPPGTGTLPDGGTATSDAGEDLSGVCTEATCPPEILLENLHGPMTLAVDGSHFYWVEVGSKIPQGGGQAQLVRLPTDTTCKERSCFDVIDYFLSSGELDGQLIYETHVAVGPTDVCTTQSFNASPQHSLRCYAKPGLTRRPFDDGAGYISDLTLDATEARWTLGSTTETSADGKVQGRALSGATPTKTFASGRVYNNGIASDGTNVFWTEVGASLTGPAGLVATTLPDGGVRAIATGLAKPRSPRLHREHVYWVEATARKVMRTRIDGTGMPEQIATTDVAPFGLAVDDTGVYFASAGAGRSGVAGSLSHAPLTPGGALTVMMSNLHNVYDLAVDAKHVYVTTLGGPPFESGKIIRIRKSR